MEFAPTIGLEIHAELKTKTKMFCACQNEPLAAVPNTNICPICLAHPGTLPAGNREAVRQVLRVGLALGGRLADYTEFDRKSYFYPDIPKGYQISQYAYPLVTGGSLNDVEITRVHLEEDTARSVHDSDPAHSLIDFNRAGVPLLELVTEPVITTARQAANFARELQLLLRYLSASAANMERGEMRVEANVSLSQKSKVKNQKSGKLGTKVEVKNLNSFRSVERAIEYELARQSELLSAGQEVVQETRGWDEIANKTFSQRGKESAHDYRYFPDPDLPPFKVGEIKEFENLAATVPELPWTKRERYRGLGFLQEQDVEQLVGDPELSLLFDELGDRLKNKDRLRVVANILLNDVAGRRKEEPNWLPNRDHFLAMVESDLAMPQIRSSILSGEKAATVSEDSLPVLVEKIIAENAKSVADWRAGKAAALQYLVGQGMRATRGAANPQTLEALLKKALEKN